MKETIVTKCKFRQARRLLKQIRNRRIGIVRSVDGDVTHTLWVYADAKDKDGVVFRRTKRPFKKGDKSSITFFNNKIKGDFNQEAVIEFPGDEFAPVIVKR